MENNKFTESEVRAMLVAAFTAGEELGQDNANTPYWASYPVENVKVAAPKYAAKIISSNNAVA